MDDTNKRMAKEYFLNEGNKLKIRTKYGTLDKTNPEIIYIRSRATITPTIKKKDFSEDIICIKNIFEKYVREIIHNTEKFEEKYICSIDMSENGIAYGKKSHLKYDVFVKPIEKKQLEEYESDIQLLSNFFNNKISKLLAKKSIQIV